MAVRTPTQSQEDTAEISEVGPDVLCKLCLCEQSAAATRKLQSCNCVFCAPVREYSSYLTANLIKATARHTYRWHIFKGVICSRKALKTPTCTELHRHSLPAKMISSGEPMEPGRSCDTASFFKILKAIDHGRS